VRRTRSLEAAILCATIPTNPSLMKNTKIALIATLLAAAAGSACQSGPKRLTRSWDDWVNNRYTENAWLHGAVLQDIFPVYGLVGLFATIGDVLVVNPYYFWSSDAFDNQGTGFVHDQVPASAKQVEGPGFD
jgi:hypothetical protein